MALAWWEWQAGLRGQGRTLLMVHATGFHARVWDQVIHHLPPQHVIALDQRGHGRSETAPFDSWRDFGQDIAGFAVARDLQGAIGIGHSMGAHALVQAAAFEPGRFSQLVLIDPVIPSPAAYHLPPPPAHLVPPASGRKNQFESAEAMVARFAQRPPYAHFHPQSLRDYCLHGLKPAPDAHGENPGHQLACAPDFEASIYASARFNPGVYASVLALQIPVLVIRAAKPHDPKAERFDPDASPTWPGLAATFAQGEEIHLPEHCHLVPMQDPALIAKLIAQRL